MITITTINNSWYFINDDFRIRPNETEVYDETTLTYRQVRDLLNAEVNNRVTLSAPDKLVLEQKLERLDGNLDVSELKTINGSSLAGPGNIAITVNSTDAQLRDRATHTGTQLAATVSDFAPSVRSTALTGLSTATAAPVTATDTVLTGVGKLQAQVDLKLDAAAYNDRFLGLFASVFDLEAAHPTASAGDYAQVDFGIGTDVIVYAWDVSDQYWSAVGSSAIANTDALPEGSSNLYHTGQRVRDTPLAGLSLATATPITSTDSVLSAAGKLQAQIAAKLNTADAPATVRDTPLTGLSTATATAITSADTVLSAAAKLQAQINAGGGAVGGFYVAGIEYNQDINGSAATTTAIATTDTMTLYPFRVVEDVTIDRYSFVTGNATSSDSSKFALYEAVPAGGIYSLTRLTEQTLVNTSAENTKYNVTASATLRARKLYFFGIISNSLRNYLAIPLTNAPSLGYATSGAGVKKTTALQSANFPITSNHPNTLNTTGFTAVTTVPIEFRFRVASA